jgi:hypothetical protein
LAARLDELSVRSIAFTTFNTADFRSWSGLPMHQPINPAAPRPGWNVVSPTVWKITQFGSFYQHSNQKIWVDETVPDERVGALLLFYFPP